MRDTRRTLQVDGETFVVETAAAMAGQYQFTWLSGRDPNYGFVVRVSGQWKPRNADLIEMIRGFLDQIDPRTGYIPDDASARPNAQDRQNDPDGQVP